MKCHISKHKPMAYKHSKDAQHHHYTLEKCNTSTYPVEWLKQKHFTVSSLGEMLIKWNFNILLVGMQNSIDTLEN